jgi:hypothetical protein
LLIVSAPKHIYTTMSTPVSTPTPEFLAIIAKEWSKLSEEGRAGLDQYTKAHQRAVPWKIEPAENFLTFRAARHQEDHLLCDLLMEVEDDGEATGRYRWHIDGQRTITVDVNAAELVPVPGAEDFKLSVHMLPSDVNFTINATSGPWEDLGELVAKGKVSVSKGDEDGSAAFLGKHNLSLIIN